MLKKNLFYLLVCNGLIIMLALLNFFMNEAGYWLGYSLDEFLFAIISFVSIYFLLKTFKQRESVLLSCVICIPALLFILLTLLGRTADWPAPRTETKVISPSQKNHVIISEACFGYGCVHEAYLIKYSKIRP